MKAAGLYFYFAVQLSDKTQLWSVDFQNRAQKVASFAQGTFITPEETIEWHGMFFLAVRETPSGASIWKTNGTPGLTLRLTSNTLSGRFSFASTTKFVFFPGTDDAYGTELWRTDGTITGTQIVKDINPGNVSSTPEALQTFGDNVVFVADDGVHGFEPWRSDGNQTNTNLIIDLEPGANENEIREFTPIRGQYLIFWATKLWSMDQLFQVAPLKDFRSGSFPIMSTGDRAFFVAFQEATGEELWTTDGTSAGTYLIQDLVHGRESSFPEMLGVANGKVFFKAYSFALDDGLFVSDGTKDGIHMLKHNFIDEVGSAVNYAYFSDFDAVAGEELWRTDGSESGTIQVKDINIDDGSSSPYSLITLKQELYFLANDGVPGGLWHTNGSSIPEILQEGSITNLRRLNSTTLAYASSIGLHRVRDGSLPETVETFQSIGLIKPALGKIFFSAKKQGSNSLFWVSDGTSEGTRPLAGFPENANISGGAVRNGYLYFFNCASGYCSKLWRTNGNVTNLIRNFPGSSITYLFTGGGLVHFVLFTKNGFEIWSSNGTAAGTKQIAISPTKIYVRSLAYPNLYFTRSSNSASLWSFNLQTKKFAQLLQSNDYYADLDFLARIENISLFYYDGQLWRTDGTPSGTFPIKNIRSAYVGRNINGKVYFSGDTSNNGQEVWVTDGTSDGTQMLFDIYKGPYGSYPAYFTLFQDSIYFSARDHEHGHELWRFKP